MTSAVSVLNDLVLRRPPAYGLPVRHGLSDGTALKIATTSVSAAGTIATTAISSGALAIGIPAAAAVPIIGAAVLGITLALNAIFNRPTQRYKVYTTSIVNDLEPQLKANVQAYFDGPRTKESQAQALANFDTAWAYLISNQACGNPDLDFPGRNCIADRSPGGKWDWFAYYRTPIADDTKPDEQLAAAASVKDPVSLIASVFTSQGSSSTAANSDTTKYLIAAALVLLVVSL